MKSTRKVNFVGPIAASRHSNTFVAQEIESRQKLEAFQAVNFILNLTLAMQLFIDERGCNDDARAGTFSIDETIWREERARTEREELDAKWKPYFLEYMSCCGGGACVPRDPALPIGVLEAHLRYD